MKPQSLLELWTTLSTELVFVESRHLAMKFGRNLSRNQVPEWSSSYINYKGLKKLIKSAAEAAKQEANVDLAGECCLVNT